MKKLYIIIVAALMSVSCSDFLKEYSQDTAYVRGYEDLDELLLGSAYMPVYSPLHFAGYTEGLYANGGDWYYPYIHLMADEVEENITSATSSSALWDARERYFGYYTWQQQVGIDPLGTTLRDESKDWTRIYKHINVTNMILADIDNQRAETDEDRLEVTRIKGEAYFLRAAYYFTLLNLYAKPYTVASATMDLAVPIKTSEFVEDKVYGRNTVEEVYEQVLSDLEDAEKCLEQTPRKSIYRADITATYLLWSRVYLYMQNWEKAVEYANKVIEKQPVLCDLNDMGEGAFFLSPDLPEVIFTMGNGGVRNSVSERMMDFGIRKELFDLYQDEDLRKTYFVKYNEEKRFIEYMKEGALKDIDRSTLSANFLFRTAEAYLNLAEASVYLDRETDARDALNDLRRNRLSRDAYSEVEESGVDLIRFIREERRKELCMEGHRWFDLRRYMVCEKDPYSKMIRHSYTTFESGFDQWGNYTNVPVQTNYYELEANDAAYTLPIPREVVDYNTGMRNNERGSRPIVETINY